MKRFASAVLAAATFAAPLALPAPAVAHDRGDRHDRGWDRGHDRRDDRRHDRRDYRRDDRRDHRNWDHRRYNGYSYRGQWHYGPPPAAYRDYADYGYRSWRRGDRLPSYYRSRYVVVNDYYRYGVRRPPPRGYHYVRDDRGELLLVGIATGVILGIIASQ